MAKMVTAKMTAASAPAEDGWLGQLQESLMRQLTFQGECGLEEKEMPRSRDPLTRGEEKEDGPRLVQEAGNGGSLGWVRPLNPEGGQGGRQVLVFLG